MLDNSSNEPTGTGGADKGDLHLNDATAGDAFGKAASKESGGWLTTGVEVADTAVPLAINRDPQGRTASGSEVSVKSFGDGAVAEHMGKIGNDVHGEGDYGMGSGTAHPAPLPYSRNHSPEDGMRGGEAQVAGGNVAADAPEAGRPLATDSRPSGRDGRSAEVKILLEHLGVKAPDKDAQGEFQLRAGGPPPNTYPPEVPVGHGRLDTGHRKHPSERRIDHGADRGLGEAEGMDTAPEEDLLQVEPGKVGVQRFSVSSVDAETPLSAGARTAAQRDNHGFGPAGYSERGIVNGHTFNLDADVQLSEVVKGAVMSAGHAKSAGAGEGLFLQLDNGIRLSLAQGGREARVKLHPESLGELRIRIRVDDDGGVRTRITVDSLMVKSVLEADAGRLREIFSQHGLTLDKYTIELGSGWSQATAHGERRSSDSGSGGRPGASSFVRVDRDVAEPSVAQHKGVSAVTFGGIDIFA